LHFNAQGLSLGCEAKTHHFLTINRKEKTMKQKNLKPLLAILCLVAVSGIVMAYSNRVNSSISGPVPGTGSPDKTGIVSVSGHLVQKKVQRGSDGTVTLSLSLQADDVFDPHAGDARNVDMVIVLDRSGSMKGRKIEDAKRAVLKLLSGLSASDRFALVTYSDSVQKYADLLSVTDASRGWLNSTIYRIRAGGGTNLGAGLKAGINTLLTAKQNGNAGKVILISDGLANKGITNSHTLGTIAGTAAEKEFSVSTVGVGAEFNEQLMTRIADRGTGNYYYLENPEAFAEVFQKEFYNARAAAATSVAVQIPLSSGISLINASGYPIQIQNGQAVFYTGDLHSGQTRKMFLTLRVPSETVGDIDISGIKVRYMHSGQAFVAELPKSFRVACVKSKREVLSSIDGEKWEEKVLKEDYNRLKQEVSHDIKAGNEKKALTRIKKYYQEQEAANTVIGSGKVADNLAKDLNGLKTLVKETFQGKPAAVRQKQKLNSKSLQYEGYRGRRAN